MITIEVITPSGESEHLQLDAPASVAAVQTHLSQSKGILPIHQHLFHTGDVADGEALLPTEQLHAPCTLLLCIGEGYVLTTHECIVLRGLHQLFVERGKHEHDDSVVELSTVLNFYSGIHDAHEMLLRNGIVHAGDTTIRAKAFCALLDYAAQQCE